MQRVSPPTMAHKAAHQAMSPEQRVQLRQVLEAKKTQLLRACEEHEEQVLDDEVESGDVADVAEGVIEDRARAALDEHDRALLGEIEHALARFATGNYGISEKTGRPIRFARLLALPWARYDADEVDGAAG